jgi:hypothetical protein
VSNPEYRSTVRPLSEEEGGGWLVDYHDLSGCMSRRDDRGSHRQRRGREPLLDHGHEGGWPADPAVLGRARRRLQREMAAAGAE